MESAPATDGFCAVLVLGSQPSVTMAQTLRVPNAVCLAGPEKEGGGGENGCHKFLAEPSVCSESLVPKVNEGVEN